LHQGGSGSVWDPEPSKERVGDWGGPATVWSSCALLKRVQQGRTGSGGIVLAANAGPRVPSGGVTLKRHCTYRPSVIYLIVNKLLSLSSSPAPRDIPRGVFIEWHTEVWTSSRNLLTLIEARHCPTASPGPRRGLGRGANVLPSQSQCRPARRERHAECPHVIFRNLNKLGRAEVRNEEK
jgi:hypothetical protein